MKLLVGRSLGPGLFAALFGLALLAACPGPAVVAEDSSKKETEAPPVFSKKIPENVEDLKALQARVKYVLKTAKPATVGLFIGQSAGSGVIVSEEGIILTAGHVSGDPDQTATIILADGSSVKGKTMGKNDNIDSGMIKITTKGTYPFVKMGKSESVKLGQWVVAVGHPGGHRKGRPAVVRVGRVVDKSKNWVQTDCALVGGDSGGPLFNLDGELVGIHSRINRPITVNVHVPVNTYRDTWDRLAAGESWGGLSDLFGMFKPGPTKEGPGFDLDRDLRITKLDKNGPPAKAGLKLGDVLRKVNGKKVNTKRDVESRLTEPVDGEITLMIDRDGETHTFSYKIGPVRKDRD
jgi:serine protease Do